MESRLQLNVSIKQRFLRDCTLTVPLPKGKHKERLIEYGNNDKAEKISDSTK